MGFLWFKKKPKQQEAVKKYDINCENIPKHIGFIMDGNGRWAKSNGLPRSEGHKRGKEIIPSVLNRCYDLGVNTVSLYALSVENLQRPKEEVDYIFKLLKEWKDDLIPDLLKLDCKFHIMGDVSLLPTDAKECLIEMVEKTKDCKTFNLNVGICYGGRRELVNAVNQIIKDGIKEVDEKVLANYLYTAGLPDLDLVVRASGEQRLSNFMLYQAAYSEFYFPRTNWPDFNADIVDECIYEYQQRNRKFGKLKEKKC